MDSMNSENIDEAVQKAIAAFRQIGRIEFGGGGYTLDVDSPRIQVLRITNSHGVGHLRELAAALNESLRHYPERTSRLAGVDNIIDLNCGAGLNGAALALLAQASGRNPIVHAVDHSVEAVAFAVELAQHLQVRAVGHVVRKKFANDEAESSDSAVLESTWLEPEFAPLSGSALVFAGHALSCWIFNQAPGAANRQRILEAQNTAVLQSLASQLDPCAPVFIGDVDVGSSRAHSIHFLTDRLKQSTAREQVNAYRCYPPNQSPGDNRRAKYAAFAELGPAHVPESTPGDDLVLWRTVDTEIVITATELAALVGDVQSCSGTIDSSPLDDVLSSLVMS
jgi:SAM-dependent methyltransferase